MALYAGHRVHLNIYFSAGGGAWAEPDPLAVEHDALLRTVLASEGITQLDLDAGKVVDVLSCCCLILPPTVNPTQFLNLSTVLNCALQVKLLFVDA